MKILPLLILTPFKNEIKVIIDTIHHLSKQLTKNDVWIIVLDNEKKNVFISLKKKFKKIIFLNYLGPKGAGNARNFGLDYIYKSYKGQFLLFPLDGDDRIVNNGIIFIKQKMKNSKFNVVSFAHCKIWPDGTRRVIKYTGIFGLNDLLKKYITPCGSTIIKVKNVKILKKLRFSTRYRCNDALFFFQAVKYFQKFECHPKVLLKYKVGNMNSLSGKKYKMIFYKFMAYKDFGLSNLKAIKFLFFYLLQGIMRYIFKLSI